MYASNCFHYVVEKHRVDEIMLYLYVVSLCSFLAHLIQAVCKVSVLRKSKQHTKYVVTVKRD